MARADSVDNVARYDAILHDDGVLSIGICGVWTAADVDRFFADIAPMYREARRRHGVTRVLTTVAAVQSPLVAARVRAHALTLARPGDRRAFVVATFLSKIQIRRLASTDGFGLFTDRDVARQWLLG